MNIDKFPKSKALHLEECVKKQLVDFIEAISNLPDTKKSMEEQLLSPESLKQTQEVMLNNSPRHLYDFFDDNEIFLSVRCAAKNNFYFKWNVKFEEGLDTEHKDAIGISSALSFNNRKKCEETAFMQLFELLEEKL